MVCCASCTSRTRPFLRWAPILRCSSPMRGELGAGIRRRHPRLRRCSAWPSIGLLYEPLLKYRPDVPMVASVGLLIFMQDAFRIVFGEQGVTFRHNAFTFTTYDIGGVRIGAVEIAHHCHRRFGIPGAASLYDAHARRRRLARRRFRGRNRREFRRRSDPCPLSQFRGRLALGGACRRAGGAPQQSRRSRDRLRRKL